MKIYSRSVLEFLLYCLLILILSRLGHWQLQRAQEKKSILTQERLASQKPLQMWQPGQADPKPFAKIKISGHGLPHLIYLDNQFYHHQLGYHVLQAVLLQDNSLVLVDYGWKKMDFIRGHWPYHDVPAASTWQGQVYYPAPPRFNMAQNVEYQDDTLSVLESLHALVWGDILHRPRRSWVLRLNGHSSEYIRQWPIVNLSPEKHQAYALQWFSMALIVLIIFLWRVFK